MEIARGMVARVYARWSNTPLDLRAVDRQLCDDAYTRAGWTRTLLITGGDPVRPMPLATARMLIGPEANGRSTDSRRSESPGPTHPFEMMELVQPRGGWEAFMRAGFVPDVSVELGRMALADHVLSQPSRRNGLCAAVSAAIYQSTAALARHHQKTQPWALMRQPIASLLELGGIRFRRRLNVALNVETNSTLFRQYSRYWIEKKLFLYEFRFPRMANSEPDLRGAVVVNNSESSA